MAGGLRPPSCDRPRLTPRETVAPAPTTDLTERIARIQARVGAAPVVVHDAVPDAGAVGAHAAEALIRAAFPVAESTTYVDRGEDGWRALGTGERAPWN